MTIPQRQKTDNTRGRNKTWKDLGHYAMGMIAADMQHQSRQSVFDPFMNSEGEIDTIDYAFLVTDSRRQRDCGRRGRVAMALIHPANNPMNSHKYNYDKCETCRYNVSKNKTRHERSYPASQVRIDMVDLCKQYNSTEGRIELLTDYDGGDYYDPGYDYTGRPLDEDD